MTLQQSIDKSAAHRRKLHKPELLAPAGNLEKLKMAVHYGADAVYIGGQKYGLRSNADNFSFDEMKQAVEYASRYDAKVFVATNIFAHNEDIEGIAAYLEQLQEAGISAIIAADPIIMETAKQVAPKVEVHVSTQQSSVNWRTVQYWKEEGAPRVVLGRETSMQEIIEIKKRVDVEIEVFIHGAMCSSYSGRCVLSNHFTDRDSNRGGCCQSCRWQYDLYQKNGNPVAADIPLFAEDDPAFSMSAKDLFMIQNVPALIESGVDSFKIEGRMKTVHYVATVVNAYRQAIDSYLDNPDRYVLKQEWLEEIYKAANRPLNDGFFFDSPAAKDHIFGPEDKLVSYDFAGLVLDYDADTKIATIQQRNYFKPEYEVEFFGPNHTLFHQKVETIWDDKGNELDAARHPLQVVKFKVNQPLKPMDIMRKKLG
ncbi:peptidase U32 family protein [Longirhabdus pacifica]|uniref:peptidase U32 family protein n=1 Tax=Longirhabdus pacifica TaxID=2305227 RepID=UPI0010093150|nr:U32 family peptidase [Longirhabdus pacifica]